jgi:dynein heavy chain, axonemal
MFQTLPDFLRLWYHESHRVFADRLVNDDDRTWFSALLSKKMKENFDTDLQQVVLHEPLLYADFLSTSSGDNRPYVEVTDHSKVILRSKLLKNSDFI